jgi:hypothetical protein
MNKILSPLRPCKLTVSPPFLNLFPTYSTNNLIICAQSPQIQEDLGTEGPRGYRL